MKHDDHLIFEALQRKWKLTSMKAGEAADKFGQEHVKVTAHGLRNGKDMVEVNVPVDDKGYDAAEDEVSLSAEAALDQAKQAIKDLEKNNEEKTKIIDAQPDLIKLVLQARNLFPYKFRADREVLQFIKNTIGAENFKLAYHAEKEANQLEHEPHGYPQGMTAIQNVLINQLKKHGFELTKISHTDKERDKYPTVFMHKKHGAMHKIAEIEGMGTINGAPYEEYMADLKNSEDEDAENRLTYNPMNGLAKTAHEIRDMLHGAANDEARTEHIIKMAQIILGSEKDYNPAEYRKMLEGLIILLNRFIVVPMN